MEPKSKRVLLIDDNALALRMVSSVLERAGFDVRATSGLAQATSTLGEWRPDVILTDVNMPGTSGVELCQQLKGAYETAHVPVVLFSALGHEELEVLARTCEADGFLCKSNLDQLASELSALIDALMF